MGGPAQVFEPQYIRGETVTGKRVDFHQNQLNPRPFVELDSPLPSKVGYEPVSKAKRSWIGSLFGR